MTATVGLGLWLTPAVDAVIRLDPVLAPALVAADGSSSPVATDREGFPPWRVHDVRWVPGHSCVLAYRVEASVPAQPRTFVAVEVRPDGATSYDLPSDVSLPGIVTALDPAVVAQRISRLCGCRVQRCLITPVRYRPGSRCVLRYDAETDAGQVTFFAKVFEPEAFAQTAPLAVRLDARPIGALVPRLAELWPDLRAVVTHAAPGPTVTQVLADPALRDPEPDELGRRLGDLLGRFHVETGVAAPAWTPDSQLASLDHALPAVAAAEPSLAARLHDVRGELAGTKPTSGREVLAHGSFRPGQVVVGPDGGLTALDVDGVRHCQAGLDLGTALAHLHWHRVRQPSLGPALTAVERGLLEGYSAAGAGNDRLSGVLPEDLAWWRAAVLAVAAVRRYRRLEVSSWMQAAELVGAAEGLLRSHRGPSPALARTPDHPDHEQLGRAVCKALGPTAVLDSIEPLVSRPARRTVARVGVTRVRGTGVTHVVAKAFGEPARARLLHENLTTLSRTSLGHGAFRVPHPLALLDEHSAVVLEHVDGIPLDSLGADDHRGVGVRLAARWLATLHTCDVMLRRSFSVADEIAGVHAWADLVGKVFPRQQQRAVELARLWAQQVVLVDGGISVPIHKDFHAGHVFIARRGKRVDVIDLDEARLGPPALDVEHFCAYLELTWDRESAARLRDLFCGEYAAHSPMPVGLPDSATLAAYCWMKIAKQWALRSGPCRRRPAQPREHEVQCALGKAEAWLTL